MCAIGERIRLINRLADAKIIGLRCGGVSSVRDRAVECFYQLRCVLRGCCLQLKDQAFA